MQQNWISQILKRFSPDVVVITGDIFESQNYLFSIRYDIEFNPYKILSEIFGDIPVICTLGNHEFWYLDVKETIIFYTERYDPKLYNVHYLDIIDSIDIDEFTFLGNVLWYDGSLGYKGQDIDSFADSTWGDCQIENFNWKKENKKCVKKILNVKTDKTKILCTHCVPHNDLNGWKDELDHSKQKAFDAYSGMRDFLKFVKPKWAFCGHSHLRRCLEIDDCNCVNCGNDYRPPHLYFTGEI